MAGGPFGLGPLELGIILLVVVPFFGAVYCLPSIIALLRGHHQTAPILVINLLLGWTLVGWAPALALCVSRVQR